MSEESLRSLLKISEDLLFSLNLPESVIIKYKTIREAALYKADYENKKGNASFMHRLDVSHEITRSYAKVIEFMVSGMNNSLDKYTRLLEILGQKIDTRLTKSKSRALENLLRDLPKLNSSRKEVQDDIIEKFKDLEETELNNLKELATEFEEYDNKIDMVIERVKDGLNEKEKKLKDIETDLNVISMNAIKETERIQEFQSRISPSGRSTETGFPKMKSVEEFILDNVKLSEEKDQLNSILERSKSAFTTDISQIQHKYETQIKALIVSHQEEIARLNEIKNNDLEVLDINHRERENSLLERLEQLAFEDTGVLKEMRVNVEKIEKSKLEYVKAFDESLKILDPLYDENFTVHTEWLSREKSRKKHYKETFNKQFVDLLIKCEFALFMIEKLKKDNSNLVDKLQEFMRNQDLPRVKDVSKMIDINEPENIESKIKENLRANNEIMKNFENARSKLLENIQTSKESKLLARSDTFENLYTKYLLKS